MKKILAILCALSLAATLSARDHEEGQDGHEHGQRPEGAAPQQQQAPKPEKAVRPARVKRAPKAAAPQPQAAAPRPARINLGRPATYRPRVQPQVQARPQTQAPAAQAPAPQEPRRMGNVVRHPSYVHAMAPERLKRMGVTVMPKPIANREHILDTDRAHSIIGLPHQGPDGHAFNQHPIGAHEWSNPVVSGHMRLVADPGRRDAFLQLNLAETQNNHYYWHHDNGFDYCHYRDQWGYHWYGWSTGGRFFWTRNYANRWWFYDDAFNRWCFWNNGFWWWQDPAHIGNLYAYSDGEYLAGTSDDSVVVSTVEPANPTTFRSPDNTRMVKLMNDTKDAFLYDTAIPPAFDPLYLASKVSNVQFSDTSQGQPLQVTLTLSDGSMESFDSQGSAVDFDGGENSDDPNHGD